MLYLQRETFGASPRAISGRTSYSRARLAFHSLPQVIPEFCTAHGFGPPSVFLRSSPCPGQARSASGLAPPASALFTLAFATPPRFSPLRLAGDTNSLAHSSIGTPSVRFSSDLRLLVSGWFQVLFHRDHLPTFHLSLTVLVHYRCGGRI